MTWFKLVTSVDNAIIGPWSDQNKAHNSGSGSGGMPDYEGISSG